MARHLFIRAWIFLCGTALVLTARGASAQSGAPSGAPSPAPSSPVVQVRIDPPLPNEDPWARLGLRLGEMADAARLRQALRVTLAGGTFAEARLSVRNVPGGLSVLVEGERRVRVREVAFVGVESRPVPNVRQDFGVVAGTWITAAELDAAVERLHLSYRNGGWRSVAVTARWRDTDDPDTRVLIVTVAEGIPTRVRNVLLENVPTALAGTVRSALALAPGDVADPVVVRRAQDAIVGELRRAGYLNAVVPPVRIVAAGPTQADIVVSLRAGQHYRLEWIGVDPFPVTGLEGTLHLDDERALDLGTTNALVNRVRDYFVRRGFFNVNVHAEVRRDPSGPDQSVLRFRVDRGERVIVRQVEFSGAERVSPSTLRGIVDDLLEGDLPFGDYAVPSAQSPVAAEHPEGSLAGGAGFLWVYPERTYAPDLFTEAAHRMQTRYREQGFLDASVSAPEVHQTRTSSGRTAIDVRYTITEGPRTVLDEVQFVGNDAVASSTLAEQISLQLGTPVSYPQLEDARSTLTDFYHEQGHSFARVEPRIERSPDRLHAREVFTITEGPEVRVGAIRIRGNRRTEEWVIRQRIDFAPGDLYRPSTVRTTQRRLGELGFFSGVAVSTRDPDVEAPVKDVQIQVIEVLPQYTELRAGFSTGEGLRAGMEYGYRNIELLGLAMTVAASAQIGYQVFIAPGDPQYQTNYQSLSLGDRIRRRLALSFIFPAIHALGPYFRETVDFASARVIERQFALDTNSISTTLTFRPSRGFVTSLTPEFQVNGLQLFQLSTITSLLTSLYSMGMSTEADRLARLLLLPLGTTTLGALRLQATLDLRDQIFNPTRGFIANATVELVDTLQYNPPQGNGAPPLSVVPGNTLHTAVSLTGYIPFPFGGIVFASNVRAGINIGLDSSSGAAGPCRVTYSNRLFFMGGADSMRGWLQDTLIPQDVIDNRVHGCGASSTTSGGINPELALTQRGGDAFINWRNELRIPLGTTGFALGAFLDLGNLWRDIANISVDLRASAGGGLRYITPFGPVAFDLGFPLARYAFEQPFAFHFSIGLF